MKMIATETPPEVELPRVASTLAEFVDWLSGFGHPDELADWLGRHGIEGIPNNALMCPLTKIARHSLAVPVRVTLGAVGTLDASADDLDAHVVESLPLPLVGVQFVKRFDTGYYRNLVVPNMRDLMSAWRALSTPTTITPDCTCPACLILRNTTKGK